jgi:hypothetical protein
MKIPSGGNTIETDFLVYKGRVFEELQDSTQYAILFCRSETKDAEKSTGVTAVVRQMPGKNAFILSLSENPSFYWSAVEAELEGTTYRGNGDISKDDFISLTVNQAGTSAEVDYMFEVGVGKIGERQKARGHVPDLHCYTP